MRALLLLLDDSAAGMESGILGGSTNISFELPFKIRNMYHEVSVTGSKRTNFFSSCRGTAYLDGYWSRHVN